MIKNKKGAVEMTMGTIVTIVLMVAILVVILFFIQQVGKTSTGAIEDIDSALTNQINELFTDGTKRISVEPKGRAIDIERGDTPKGFAFSILNNKQEEANFEYTLSASDVSDCTSMTKEKADSFSLAATGSFPLGPNDSLELARLIKFRVPESSPACTIIYDLDVKQDSSSYVNIQIFVTIK
ncbi:hypothetical protein HOD88_02150 [archaeon]|jgi:hypothetical protein|nr:hypothetical protein [archaeon]